MRKQFLYLLPSLLMVVACADENTFGTSYAPALAGHYLHLSAQSVTFAAAAGTQRLNVSSVSTPWKFEGAASWLTLTPERGDGDADIALSALENLSGDAERTSVFRFLSTDAGYAYSRNVSATQRAAEPVIRLSSTALTFSAAAGSQQVAVESNLQWTPAVDADWLTVTASEDDSQLLVAAAENNTQATRHATVTVVGTGLTQTISVTQAQPATPVVEGSELRFGNTGGSYQLTVTSEVAWTASTSEAWIDLQPQGGNAGKSVLTVTALPNDALNERTGFVYLRIGDAQVLSLPVSQRGIYLELTPAELNFTADASLRQLHVDSNTDWTVLECPDWITPSETTGQGEAELTLTAADYWGTDSRKGRLRLGKEGTALEATATLVQAGRTFDNLLTSLDFGPDAASQTVTIATDGQWTAEASDSWLTVTPVSGTGETVVSIAVTDNMSSEPRPGSVIVTVGSITRIIAVTQAGRYFTVDPTSFAELPSKGGTHAVHIATNEAWTATSTSNWIQLSARSGKGDVDVTLTVPDNPSIHARKDTTAFAPIYHQPVRVVTSQAARYLRVDVSALSFFAKGGVSQPVTVTTDASYTVTTSVSWLTVQQTGDVFTVTAAGNTDESERTGEVIISMIGLMGHEHYALKIPVSQCALSAGVDVQPFGEEQQWDVYAGSQATIRVTGFAAERSWDDAASGRATVSVTTFGEDQRWD